MQSHMFYLICNLPEGEQNIKKHLILTTEFIFNIAGLVMASMVYKEPT